MFSEHKIPTAWISIYCRYTGPWELQCCREHNKFPKSIFAHFNWHADLFSLFTGEGFRYRSVVIFQMYIILFTSHFVCKESTTIGMH